MPEIVKYLLGGSVPTIIVISLFIYVFPNQAEKWASIIFKIFSYIKRSLHRKHIQYDLQGRINVYIGKMRKQIPFLSTTRIKINWVDPSSERKSFIENDQVVLRLRKDDPNDQNFIHGTYMFVSSSLLFKSKRYISPSQREAIDLYVTSRIIESEKPGVLGFFLDEYLIPRTKQPEAKVSVYLDDYAIIDQKGGLFGPVYLQELKFLGEKVFGRRNESEIIGEVDSLIQFLKSVATRQVGDIKTDLKFIGPNCRMEIVIVGRPEKLDLVERWLTYIEKALVNRGIESIYVLSRYENKEIVREICNHFEDEYRCERRVRFNRSLYHKNRIEPSIGYMEVLRKKEIPIIHPSIPAEIVSE